MDTEHVVLFQMYLPLLLVEIEVGIFVFFFYRQKTFVFDFSSLQQKHVGICSLGNLTFPPLPTLPPQDKTGFILLN